MSLPARWGSSLYEAGIDEAGRGCLAGPVIAAAVILPPDYANPSIRDSKQLSATKRYAIREEILREAWTWSIGSSSPKQIDAQNILQASISAMHEAINLLSIPPDFLVVDGNRFNHPHIPFQCLIKGDNKILSVAAASILAKTFRDDLMTQLDKLFPMYQWKQNKGYPTDYHRKMIQSFGVCEWHRRSFLLLQPPTLFD